MSKIDAKQITEELAYALTAVRAGVRDLKSEHTLVKFRDCFDVRCNWEELSCRLYLLHEAHQRASDANIDQFIAKNFGMSTSLDPATTEARSMRLLRAAHNHRTASGGGGTGD